jgi:8-oxo-dGTP pyrophosphatase MutT (NUDIX family)
VSPPRQVIPRPPRTTPGGPAPWASLDRDARRGIRLEPIRRALAAHRHALAGDERVAYDNLPAGGAPAAVLVPLFEEDGETRVVLTRRAAHLRTHTGEVSFPGGRLHAGEDPEVGALREAAEEIGLDPASVERVGELTRLATFSSAATITPVVGVLAGRPELEASPAEVEHVFDVALATLATDGVFREERWYLPHRPPLPAGLKGGRGERGWFPMWFFDLPEDIVWGATARMLVELLRLSLGVADPPSPIGVVEKD